MVDFLALLQDSDVRTRARDERTWTIMVNCIMRGISEQEPGNRIAVRTFPAALSESSSASESDISSR